MKWAIRISGRSGQGIKKIGELLAEASLLEGLNVVQSVVYTPEVREGSSSTDVIISEEEIYYPFVRKIDILLAFTQEAYTHNLKKIVPETTVIYDSSNFTLPKSPNSIAVPFENLSLKEYGKNTPFNMMALGFLVSFTKIVHHKHVANLILKKIKGSKDINIQLFFKGIELGKKYEKKV